tara:strand:+ start:1248 stop:1469 length:222 start_codon:yes stop_codon:yes gene_type:complete
MNIDLQIGDTILTGRFKNKKVVVKEFGVDDKGQPTVNGRPMLKFRIQKLVPGQQDVNEVVKKHIKKAINKKSK